MKRWIALMLLCCTALPLWAASGTTQIAQIETERAVTRVFLPLSGPAQHTLLTLDNPPRLVIDLNGSGVPSRMLGLQVPGSIVTLVRSGSRERGALRVVLDLNEKPRDSRAQLEKNQHGEYRLAVELRHAPRMIATAPVRAVNTAASPTPVVTQAAQSRSPEKIAVPSKPPVTVKIDPPITVAKAEAERPPSATPTVKPATPTARAEPVTTQPPVPANPAPATVLKRTVKPGPIIIAVDAGHGGKDPGAVGGNGTHEKDVTLGIARELARRIDREPGMKAVLIRDGDYFLTLRQRIQKARKHQADLFVSVHADAFKNTSSRGSSVYVLSQRGATSEAARWLAERENAADLVGGVKLHDKDDVLAQVLLDLSQTATIDASFLLADRVLGELGRLGPLHKEAVQQAGFLVLKSPDIPSILVETAFITNPHEERRLKDPSHQRRIASAIFSGLRAYALERMPDTRFASMAQAQESELSLAGDPALSP